jgi:hypothetical protein
MDRDRLAGLITNEFLTKSRHWEVWEIRRMNHMAGKSDAEFFRSMLDLAYRMEQWTERVRVLASEFAESRMEEK